MPLKADFVFAAPSLKGKDMQCPKGARLILLTQGKYAIVDKEDYEWLNQYKWYALKNRNTFYVVRNEKMGNKWFLIFMHRQILNVPKGKQTDHADRNGLNNQRTNLRICTNSENQQGRQKSSTAFSKFKGISKEPRSKKYVARIQINKRRIYIGAFSDEIQAAKAYDKKAKEFYGINAKLNF